jgi:hypothetical protein
MLDFDPLTEPTGWRDRARVAGVIHGGVVEIVSDDGAIVASRSASGSSVAWSTTLTSGTSHYYYARISTASGPDGLPGPTAWTAPVWTGR